MIRTSKQLKDKVRNLSEGDSRKAQTYIRNFIMERFLERMALSKYRNNFILKGGMLVAAVVGIDTRATLDIDATVRNLPLARADMQKIIEDIIAVEIPDGVSFRITRIADIMEEHDYPGIRFILEARLDNMRQTVKIDISTGDIITPSAVEYSYRLMMEERSISVWTYNMETLLAEKLETVMQRGTGNTRLRDFYDICLLEQEVDINPDILKQAFAATSRKRGTVDRIPEFMLILDEVEHSEEMRSYWNNYRRASFYVGELEWSIVMAAVKRLANLVTA